MHVKPEKHFDKSDCEKVFGIILDCNLNFENTLTPF